MALAPEPRGADGPHAVLAGVYRKLGMAAEERRLLEQLADQTSDAIAGLPAAAGDRRGEAAIGRCRRKNAERLLAVNPMLEAGWRGRGQALEAARATGDRASQAGRSPPTSGCCCWSRPIRPTCGCGWRKLLKHKDRRAAKRHLLEALAEAPRLRAGHQLLLELAGPSAAERTMTRRARWQRWMSRVGPVAAALLAGGLAFAQPDWEIDRRRSGRHPGLGRRQGAPRGRVHLRAGEVPLDGRPAALGAGLAHRLPGQRHQPVVPAAAADLAEGEPPAQGGRADRPGAVRLPVHLHDRAGGACRWTTSRWPTCAATCWRGAS